MIRFAYSATLLGLILAAAAPLHGQQTRRASDPGRQNSAPQQEITREVWQLLDAWAKRSAEIKTLEGKHERHVYDDTFMNEKVSNGKFWFGAPDKGRIDVFPIKITAAMIAARNKPGAKVERKPNGDPYDLKSDDAERWLCDGIKIYDIDDEEKTARVVHLPPDLRGQNIMNSPLPFLFGLPPEKAVQRFHVELVQDYRPDFDVVLLRATPKLRQDLDNWKEAQIFLNTKSYLPDAVKLLDPAGTKRTVYTFQEMSVNKKEGIFGGLLPGQNPWDPKIRGYQIHVIQPGQQQKLGQAVPPQGAGPKGSSIPNVIGQRYDVATKLLIAAGVPKDNISNQNAGPAPRENLTYLVRDQDPREGMPISRTQKVVLKIFDKPQKQAAAGGQGGDRQSVATSRQ
ncbi:MAG: PASTA domain-containing protein [Fuerstiella sp.]|nr:PASTA domain-containing protein [Fuerstiella sp.]